MIESVIFRVNGMSCAGCTTKLERALESTNGVKDATVTLDPGKAAIRYDSDKVGPPVLRDVVEGLGFDIIA